jgi:ElaB/YqjD/DUF883 family membrane-anchored ribosome-binding protein
METPDELRRNDDVEQLKAEISETQSELQHTVAEIQERLSPAHLKHQAADSVREAATNAREATIGRVQYMMRGQNPIPFALIGVGAAWLLMANRRRGNGYTDYTDYDESWSNSTSYISSDDEFASPYVAEGAESRGGRWANGARERTAHVRERASHMSSQARERARRAASQARSRWDTMVHDNPLAVGIAAVAAGALVGAALPRTDMENQYLGETRDSLVESAKEMAHDSLDSAREAAKDTVGNVLGGSSTASPSNESKR